MKNKNPDQLKFYRELMGCRSCRLEFNYLEDGTWGGNFVADFMPTEDHLIFSNLHEVMDFAEKKMNEWYEIAYKRLERWMR